jgi:type III restriction enzyme
VLDEGKGLSTKRQAYDLTSIINEIRNQVDTWRALPASQWQVTPETARLLEHWRHHEFGSVRPFFCQVEAIETAIWITEVAPHLASGKRTCAYQKLHRHRQEPPMACYQRRQHATPETLER